MAEQQQTEPQTGGTPAGAGAEDKKGWVPQERLAAVSHQNQELRQMNATYAAKLQELEEKITSVTQPKPEHDPWTQQFYTDPAGVVKRQKEETIAEIKKTKDAMLEEWDYTQTLGTFRSAPGYSEEMENAMAGYIQRHSWIKSAPKGAAIRAAYEAVTKNEWGKWGDNNYSTKKVKERLSIPAGAGGKTPEMMSPEEFRKLPNSEYKKNPQKYAAMVKAWREANDQWT